MNFEFDNYTVLILIDYDNYLKLDLDKCTPEQFEFELGEIILDTIEQHRFIETIKIRLYGGWRSKGILTNKASKIILLLSQINLFPIIKRSKKIEGQIELATSLISYPDIIWDDTYKERHGIPRLRLDHSKVGSVCNANRQDCPHFILYRFTDGKEKLCSVTGCVNQHRDMFKAVEQKMVDTLIACDIVSMVNATNLIGIYLLSDDFDHLPSVALASFLGRTEFCFMRLGLKNPESFLKFNNILSGLNISLKLYNE